MKKSEKILLSMVAAASLYGLVDFSLKSISSKPSDIEQTQDNATIDMISKELSSTSEHDSSLLASLTEEVKKPWTSDVFLHEKQLISLNTTSETAKVVDDPSALLKEQAQKLTYSGFLSMGNAKIAIIDGLDYQKNESVNGFHITDITENTVKLIKNGMSFKLIAKNETKTGHFTTPPQGPKNMTLDN